MNKINKMNKWEKEYDNFLSILKYKKIVLDYRYEGITFKLAYRTTYTPDFLVVNADKTVTIIEIKGFRRDDAMAKFKIAAQMYPYFRFKMITKKKGDWAIIYDFNKVARAALKPYEYSNIS